MYGRWQFEFGAACPTSNLYSLLTPPPPPPREPLGTESTTTTHAQQPVTAASHALLIYARLVHITHLRSLVGAGRTRVLAEWRNRRGNRRSYGGSRSIAMCNKLADPLLLLRRKWRQLARVSRTCSMRQTSLPSTSRVGRQ